MNKNMEKSRLIQRLKEPVGYDNPFVFGGGLKSGGIGKENMDILMQVFSFDYMGAAEFEFGAVPKAFDKVIENASDYVKGSLTAHWKTLQWKTGNHLEGDDEVYFLCHKDQVQEVKKRIGGWAMGNNLSCHPKEGVRLDSSFDDKYFHGWFELNNGFFFFTNKTMWENTCKLFEIPGNEKDKK